MSTWKGKKIEVEIFGASHNEEIGVIMKNFPTETFDIIALKNFLKRRKPTYSPTFTSRNESDTPIFLEGVSNNNIIGSTVKCVIKNEDAKKSDYDNLYAKPRPSHADLAAYYKDGRLDFSGGGEFSGRMTAPLSIAGGIAKQFLEKRGVTVCAYLSRVGTVKGKSYKDGLPEKTEYVGDFPALSNEKEMLLEIENAKKEGDSVGGIVECVISGFKKGVGGELFDGLEGKIANLIYAIPGVKGVEFGYGFSFAELKGSAANDQISVDNGKIFTTTNKSGGINGGVSNGMPITFSVAFRPTPSIAKKQSTVDLQTLSPCEIEIAGRHDACIAVRAVPVVEAAAALALLDTII